MRPRHSYKLPPPGPGIQHPVVWAGVIGATLLFVLLFKAILWISLPTVLALVIYYICAPAVDWLKQAGLSHDQSIWGLLAVVIGGITLALFAALPWLSAETYHLQNHFNSYFERGNDLILTLMGSMERAFPWLANSHLTDRTSAFLQEWTHGVIDRNVQALFGFLATWLPALLLVPYLTFFFLRDGLKFKKMLMRGVPNAFFEKVMLLFYRMDRQIHQYFRGMLTLTLLDTATLGLGLWIIGRPYGLFHVPHALTLGLVCAVFAWVPYVGSVMGCLLVLLVCSSEAPQAPLLAASAGILFLAARLADDFVYSPMTVGKSLNIHPLLTVIMIFVGGSTAGIAGLLLVLPVLGICSVIGEVFEQVWFDAHLRARHAHAANLRKQAAAAALEF